jgi:dsDNA-specific endonuclease/ATPase MutS2
MEDTEPVRIPITDVLDLHTFRPKEVPNLLDDYLDACLEAGISVVRIIHGKGTGTLKRRVQGLLKRDPRVVAFEDAPADAGGWGATRVYLAADE